MTDRPIRFVALNGSERPKGTTAHVLESVEERLRALGGELETIHLCRHRVVPCDCGRCNSRGDPCDVDDDVPWIVGRMAAADCVLYAAPVHGFGLASVMQNFIERAGVGRLRFDRPLTNKIGGAIVTGRRYSHESVHAQPVNNLLLNRMIVIGSGFPAVVHSGSPRTLDLDREGRDAVFRMLDRMVELARFIRSAKDGSGTELSRPDSAELRVGSLS